MRRYLAFVLLLASLGGCSIYGPQYRPQSWLFWVGYQEEELAPRVYRVEFKGSEPAYGEFQVEDFALLRAAELTLEKEYRYFVIVTRETHVSGGDSSLSYESHLGPEWGDTPGMDTMDPHLHASGNPHISWRHVFDVEFLRSRPPGDGQFVYDAAFVQGAVRREYRLGPVPERPDPRIVDDGT